MKIAQNSSGDSVIMEGYNKDGYAVGYIRTAEGNKVPVLSLASLIYRGVGWKLTRSVRLLPETPGENTD